MVEPLPRVWLLMGGATLRSQGAHRLDLARYNVAISGQPRLSGAAILAALPEIAQVARVEVDEGEDEPRVGLDGLQRLALRVQALLAPPDVQSLVYVQGTNSLEEVAFFLNLTVRSPKPVVITGAQRPFTALSSDGPLNLYNAVRVAAHPEARGKGVLVVLNDEINAGRDVTKTSTYRVQTFRSRDLGPLGYADPDRVVFYRAPLRRHTLQSEFDLTAVERLPRVDILYVHAGAGPDLAQAAVDRGAAGLVIAGIGAGGLGALRETLAALAHQGIAVVRGSRVGEGRVIRDDNYQEPGMIAADNLNPQKAALLLALALTRTRDPEAIQRLFDEY